MGADSRADPQHTRGITHPIWLEGQGIPQNEQQNMAVEGKIRAMLFSLQP